MQFYEQYADWWPLFSAPVDYKEEAGLFWNIIQRHHGGIKTALELGAGGGNNACFLKKHCEWTLNDLSAGMLAVSQKLNPACRHVVGDMRHLDLGQRFDLVFIHDAISTLTRPEDLRQTFATARRHLQPDGLLLIVPDFFRESFQPSTGHGGNDGAQRSLRYLEWCYDPDATDNTVRVEYAFLLREADGTIIHFHDHTRNGLFSRDEWKKWLEQAGFAVQFEAVPHSELPPGQYQAIVAHPK